MGHTKLSLNKKKICIVLTMGILILLGFTDELFVRYVLYRKNFANYNTVLVNLPATGLYAKEKILEKPSHKWVILVHSYGADHSMMNEYADEYFSRGYNTLSPDNRAHGVSEGKYIGMGYLDQFDIRRWIHYVLTKDPEAEIVLHGISMGAAALMMLSAQEELPDNIVAVIEDSGFVSAESYLTWKLKQRFHMPAFPIIPITNVAFKLHAGYWMTDASAIEAVKCSSVPILFIHGTSDTTVPVEDAYKLYDAAQCDKNLYIADKATHGDAMHMNPAVYWENVFEFLEILSK